MKEQVVKLSVEQIEKHCSAASCIVSGGNDSDFLKDLTKFLNDNIEMNNESDVSIEDLKKGAIQHRHRLRLVDVEFGNIRRWTAALLE